MSVAGVDLPPLAAIGIAGSERMRGFVDAVRQAGHRVHVIDWVDVLADPARSAAALPAGAVVRLDSPGDDTELERDLALRGVDDPAAGAQLAAAPIEPGRIGHTGWWYAGFTQLAREFQARLPIETCVTPDARDLAVMFDKRRCHALCVANGIAVPDALMPEAEPVAGWGDLRERMAAAGRWRVFVKPAHGSSASGVVALAVSRDGRARAVTPVELVRDGNGGGEGRPTVKLFNSKRVRTYTAEDDIAALFDALASERLHVEAWVPKATFAGGPCDLRVLVLGGRAHHVVPRIGRSPLTNLHLGRGNRRGDADDLRRRAGDAAWDAMLATCEQAAALFPRTFMVAVDVAFTAHFRGHRVLELNAFGDWLRRVQHHGRDPWQAWLDALPAWLQD